LNAPSVAFVYTRVKHAGCGLVIFHLVYHACACRRPVMLSFPSFSLVYSLYSSRSPNGKDSPSYPSLVSVACWCISKQAMSAPPVTTSDVNCRRRSVSRCAAFSATMAAVAAATRATSAPLAHLRVLDLSRVLAGRPCDHGRRETGPAGANGLPNQVVVRVGAQGPGRRSCWPVLVPPHASYVLTDANVDANGLTI